MAHNSEGELRSAPSSFVDESKEAPNADRRRLGIQRGIRVMGPAAVDAANISNKSSTGLTYPSILQLLESGLCTFVFITTNSFQTLQQMKAAVRPGRIDYTLEFKNATPEQVKGLFMMFYADFKKCEWRETKLEDLEADFKSAFDAAKCQVELLRPSDQSDGFSDPLVQDVAFSSVLYQKRLHLCEHRISHLERIMEKVYEISFSSHVQREDRKHWLNALASIAGNHFQSKIYKYSMAQIEKFFQNMILGHNRT